ncbi:hypothetical protein [Actinacidiphila acididurans]|uniref:Uncharacterized protein n=1 Tax=Actinacidiphila acididurans TaxID=2784346 RepID=A0ABS2TR79_9ACTN|nr:hypothetical protein [Actinacidiphila acididurans]MBM9505834.1 hypothetical protein [Actinacidiphila acididurans]
MTVEEDDLRALLERGVPQLPAPAQRLERIRERVRRRRRRRAAGVSALLVTAIAGAGVLLPGGGRDGGAGTEPGAPPPAAAGTAAPTTDPRTFTPPPTTDKRLVRFGNPALTLRLPPGWQGSEAYGNVFAASQALWPQAACAQPTQQMCLPLRHQLAPGGGYLVVSVVKSPGLAAKAVPGKNISPALTVPKDCRVEGGTEQWYVMLADPHRPATGKVLTGVYCLARPTAAERRAVQDALLSVSFS